MTYRLSSRRPAFPWLTNSRCWVVSSADAMDERGGWNAMERMDSVDWMDEMDWADQADGVAEGFAAGLRPPTLAAPAY